MRCATLAAMVDPVILEAGVLSVRELLRLGWGRRQREAALAAGRLTRVRKGWFAHPGADARLVAAVRGGGCVSCASALRMRGVWVPEHLGRDHVRRVRRGNARVGGCQPFGATPPVDAAIDSVETAFRCVLRCGSAEDVIVIADSLLHLGLATREALTDWLRDAPERIRARLESVDRAESGTESMVRLRLRARNIRVQTQVRIGWRRVDILVGERLIIECDGAEHHRSWAAQAHDRERDRKLTAAGYTVVRLTYRQIVDDWQRVEQDLLRLVRQGRHCAPRRAR